MSDKQAQAILDGVLNSDTAEDIKRKMGEMMLSGGMSRMSIGEDAELRMDIFEQSDIMKQPNVRREDE